MIKQSILSTALLCCWTPAGAQQQDFGDEYIAMTANTDMVMKSKRPATSEAIDKKIKEVKKLLKGNDYPEWSFDTVGWNGWGHPVKPVGLIASVFRPSDDATVFPFLIPSNFMAVTSLRKAADNHAVVRHPKYEYGDIYAFEVDGYGSHLLMDDANVPSLLAMGYLGDVPMNDPIYQNTRRFVWSDDNSSFFRGRTGEGIGGLHVGYDMPWPMSIMMRAFTSYDDAEIKEALRC